MSFPVRFLMLDTNILFPIMALYHNIVVCLRGRKFQVSDTGPKIGGGQVLGTVPWDVYLANLVRRQRGRVATNNFGGNHWFQMEGRGGWRERMQGKGKGAMMCDM